MQNNNSDKDNWVKPGIGAAVILALLVAAAFFLQWGENDLAAFIGLAPGGGTAPNLFFRISNEQDLLSKIPSAIADEAILRNVARVNADAIDTLLSGAQVSFSFEQRNYILAPTSIDSGNPTIVTGKAYKKMRSGERANAPNDFRIAINRAEGKNSLMGIVYANPGENSALMFSSSRELPDDAVALTDQRLLERHLDPIPAPNGPGGSTRNPSGSEENLRGTPPVTIDVMIVYNQTAVDSVGGIPGIQNWIALRAAETNQAYVNSMINQQIRIVYTGLVNYNSDAGGDHIVRLRGTNDGYMDEIHPLRDQFGADLVMLLIPNASYCGIAYLMNRTHLGNTSFAPYGFSVVMTPCGNLYTFSHELGHNMGALHDREASGAVGAGPNNSAVSLNPYGYKNTPFWRTIMSYNCPSPGCPRIPNFSNPSVLYNGIPTGIAPPDLNAAENFLALNTSASTVVGLRNATVPPSAPSPPINLQASDGTDNMISISWSPAAGAGATNFILYRSTVNDSTTALLHGTLGYVTAYTDYADVEIGWTYYYWVRAQNEAGLSNFSAGDAGYASNSTSPPAVPANVRASDGEYTDRINLAWNLSAFANGYRIYNLAAAPGCSGAPLADLHRISSNYSDYSFLPGQLVNFSIVAYNDAGESLCTGTDTGYVSNCPNGDPDGRDLTCTRTVDTKVYPDPTTPNTADHSVYNNGSNWNATRNAASGILDFFAYQNYIRTSTSIYPSYRIFRSFFAFNPNTFPSGTSIVDAVLEWYVLSVFDLQNDQFGLLHILEGQQTNPLIPSTGDYSKCPAISSNQYATPVDISTITGQSTLRIPLNRNGIAALWQAANNGQLFKLCSLEGHDYANVAPVVSGSYTSHVSAHAYPSTGTAPNNPPPRLIIRYNQAAATVPNTPMRVRASDGTFSNQVVVTWDVSAGTTRYEVWKSTVKDSATATLIGNSNTLSFTDSPVQPIPLGPRYFYWVRAQGGSGVSPFSDSDQGYAAPARARGQRLFP